MLIAKEISESTKPKRQYIRSPHKLISMPEINFETLKNNLVCISPELSPFTTIAERKHFIF